MANVEENKAKNKKLVILGIVLVVTGAAVVITGWILDGMAYSQYQACFPCPLGLALARLARNVDYACLVSGAACAVLGIIVWVRAAKARQVAQ
jgi:hypothetical protein